MRVDSGISPSKVCGLPQPFQRLTATSLPMLTPRVMYTVVCQDIDDGDSDDDIPELEEQVGGDDPAEVRPHRLGQCTALETASICPLRCWVEAFS